jgi:hypothetical protein
VYYGRRCSVLGPDLSPGPCACFFHGGATAVSTRRAHLYSKYLVGRAVILWQLVNPAMSALMDAEADCSSIVHTLVPSGDVSGPG